MPAEEGVEVGGLDALDAAGGKTLRVGLESLQAGAVPFVRPHQPLGVGRVGRVGRRGGMGGREG